MSKMNIMTYSPYRGSGHHVSIRRYNVIIVMYMALYMTLYETLERRYAVTLVTGTAALAYRYSEAPRKLFFEGFEVLKSGEQMELIHADDLRQVHVF